jgi:hypothetical protein
MVFTVIVTDLLIGIVIILLHKNYIPYFRNLQHYTEMLGWKFEHVICNEDRLSSSMHVQTLSEGGFLDSSGTIDSSPGWP